MITLEQYVKEYPLMIAKLEDIYGRASRIKEWPYDPAPSNIMRRIATYIEKMKKVYAVFTTAPSYQTQDFTSYLEMVEKDTADFLKECVAAEERSKRYKYK